MKFRDFPDRLLPQWLRLVYIAKAAEIQLIVAGATACPGRFTNLYRVQRCQTANLQSVYSAQPGGAERG